MNTAKIIVIDGGANIGKATQADMLMNRLMNEGYSVGKMDFPRYNQNAIGHLLQETISADMDILQTLNPKILATIFAADRFESKKQIEEWIAEGRVIIFDRYVSSNMLHQGSKVADPDQREEFFNWVEHLEFEVFGLPRPNLTIYLDVPPNESEKLLGYVEQLGVTVVATEDKARVHQAKVSECARYLSTAQLNWHTVQCLENGELRNRDAIHAEVYEIVKQKCFSE
jgi:dTMP kinase